MGKVDLKQAIAGIKKAGAKTVLLQLPEGLKAQAAAIAEEIEKKTSASAIVLCDPCFGACDLAEEKARALGAGLLVHFGHSAFFKPEFPTVFVPLEREMKESEIQFLAAKAAEQLNKRRIKTVGLVATVQYASALKQLQAALKKQKISALTEGNGQILGCSFENAEKIEKRVGAFVLLCDGLFHALGLAYSVKKPVFLADALSKTVKEIAEEKELFLRRRSAAIASAVDAKVLGIIVSTKKGQMKERLALELKKKIEEHGKKAVVLAMDLVKPEYLLGVGVDAFVSTACPRIAAEDSVLFKKPLLNPKELLVALGENQMQEKAWSAFGALSSLRKEFKREEQDSFD
jgi:2-(3-amino-3-carboxypropyl)histidine synthase